MPERSSPRFPRRGLAAGGAALLGLAGRDVAAAPDPDAELIGHCAAWQVLERQFLATDFQSRPAVRPRPVLPVPEHLIAVAVRGDTMANTLRAGDQVMVDVRLRTPSPPGLFLIWDGLAAVVRRLEYLPHRTPPVVRLISDNPRYASHEVAVGRVEVIGRVICSYREV